jgi:hypothetical protein
MKTKDLIVRDHYYCSDTDAFLLVAECPERKDSLKKFVVGWINRRNPEKLIKPSNFLDAGTADKAFRKALGEDRPIRLQNSPDKQKKRVYEWEEKCVAGAEDPVFKDEDEAKKLVRKIARKYNIPRPSLKWADHGRSMYEDDKNRIIFGHRTLQSLLHEMAHAVHFHRNGEDNAQHHGPAFVWIAIDLYNRYGGHDLGYLVQSAANFDVLGALAVRSPDLYVGKTAHQAALLKPAP